MPDQPLPPPRPDPRQLATTIPYPRYADGRLDTIWLRDHYPFLKDFRDKQLAAMVAVKALRNRGLFREFPQFLAVPFTWDEDRGDYEGPLTPSPDSLPLGETPQ